MVVDRTKGAHESSNESSKQSGHIHSGALWEPKCTATITSTIRPSRHRSLGRIACLVFERNVEIDLDLHAHHPSPDPRERTTLTFTRLR